MVVYFIAFSIFLQVLPPMIFVSQVVNVFTFSILKLLVETFIHFWRGWHFLSAGLEHLWQDLRLIFCIY